MLHFLKSTPSGSVLRLHSDRWVAVLGLATLSALLLAFNGLAWMGLNRLLRQQESAVAERMLETGRAISVTLTPSNFLVLSFRDERDHLDLPLIRRIQSPSYVSLLEELERQQRAAGLRSLVLLTPDGRIVADPDQPNAAGEEWLGLSEDDEEFQKAIGGDSTSTPLRRLSDFSPDMCAYVPVPSGSGGAVALLRLQAGSAYFNGFIFLRRTLGFALLLSTTLVLMGAWVLIRLFRRALAIERAISQSDRLTSLGTLAAGLAHEIRNPLTIIRLTCEEIRAGLAPSQARDGLSTKAAHSNSLASPPQTPSGEPATAALVADIQEEVRRMEGLVDHFLAFSRPDAIRSDPRVAKLCDPGAVAQRIGRLFQKGLNESSVRLAIHVPQTPLPPVTLDEKTLGQALLNLLRNAQESMPATGGGSISLHVEQTPRGQIRFMVRDSGAGMTEEQQRHAFDPFYTTKKAGTGLGLALVHQWTRAAGGEVELKSAPGKGTTATLTLPILQLPASGAQP